MKSIAVFCGANKGFDPIFELETARLGRLLAERNLETIFGGGSVGLMGVLADSVLAAGGQITGVITRYLFENREVGHPFVGNMILTETMTERKTRLLELSDGILTLPGGFGSLDELFEAATLAQLHLYEKPIGLYNLNGFYSPLIQQIEKMIETGFIRAENRSLLLVDDSLEDLLDRMAAYRYEAIPKWF